MVALNSRPLEPRCTCEPFSKLNIDRNGFCEWYVGEPSGGARRRECDVRPDTHACGSEYHRCPNLADASGSFGHTRDLDGPTDASCECALDFSTHRDPNSVEASSANTNPPPCALHSLAHEPPGNIAASGAHDNCPATDGFSGAYDHTDILSGAYGNTAAPDGCAGASQHASGIHVLATVGFDEWQG